MINNQNRYFVKMIIRNYETDGQNVEEVGG